MASHDALVPKGNGMIDGWFKRHIDPLWETAARPLVAVGLSANQVTLIGLGLVAANSLAFLWHRSTLWFGLGLAVSFAADALDGAVARLRGQSSMFGGYLDAMTDRYQELVVLLAIAVVSDQWLASFLVLSGAFITSYAKARTAIERPIDNVAWPDMFERLERIIYLCAMLVLDGLAQSIFGTRLVLVAGLWLLAILTHATAIQRMVRAAALLRADAAAPRSAPDGKRDRAS
jgi:phosphatidylglycerophosphate synthase